MLRIVFTLLACVALVGCDQQPRQYDHAIKALLSGDTQTALEQLGRLARSDYGPAQLRLGVMYGSGTVMQPDLPKAVHWITTAAQGGDFAAAYFLADLYASGKWLSKDPAKALVWYQQAAERGFVPAQYHTAMLYAAGYGVDSNNRAVKWMQAAARNHHKQAMLTMADWYAKGAHGLPKDAALEAHWRSSVTPRVLWGVR